MQKLMITMMIDKNTMKGVTVLVNNASKQRI